jgi:hypothetical protein
MEHVVRDREGVEAGEMKVDDPYQLANTLYATGLGGLQLARLGILVRSGPGHPRGRPAAPGPGEGLPGQGGLASGHCLDTGRLR